MKYKFNLEIGTLTNLKGNGVIYWNNQSYDQDMILAINFNISAFPFDKNLVMTTFPLTIFETREEFMFYIIQSQCDLIYLGDSHLEPLGNTYVLSKSQYKQLNHTMESYLEYYRDKISEKMNHLHPQQKISLMNAWVTRLQNHDSEGEDPFFQDINYKIEKMITSLDIKGMNQSDIASFIEINNSDFSDRLTLMKLYLKKFFALLEEEYEEIVLLNKKIEKLKKDMIVEL